MSPNINDGKMDNARDDVEDTLMGVHNLVISLQEKIEMIERNGSQGDNDDGFDDLVSEVEKLLLKTSPELFCNMYLSKDDDGSMYYKAHELLHMAQDLVLDVTSTSGKRNENSFMSATSIVGSKLCQCAIASGIQEMMSKGEVRWRRMRSVVNDVMCYIHKHVIDSLVNEIGEGKKSEFSDIVVRFLHVAFESIRRFLQYLDAELVGKYDFGDNRLPEAFTFVGMLSTVANIGSDKDLIFQSTIMATSPLDLQLILTYPCRKKYITSNISSIPWDEVGVAKLVENFYVSEDSLWPYVFSHRWQWRLVFLHSMTLISQSNGTILLSILSERVQRDVICFNQSDKTTVKEALIDLIEKLLSTVSSQKTIRLPLHDLIKHILNDRCDKETQVLIVYELSIFYREQGQLSVVPLVLDLLRPLIMSSGEMPFFDINGLVSSTVDQFMFDDSCMSPPTCEYLLNMHEVYVSLSALVLLLFRQNGPSSIVSRGVGTLKSLLKEVKCHLDRWSQIKDKSVLPENAFRLQLTEHALSHTLEVIEK